MKEIELIATIPSLSEYTPPVSGNTVEVRETEVSAPNILSHVSPINEMRTSVKDKSAFTDVKEVLTVTEEDQDIRVTLRGFGEEVIPNSGQFYRIKPDLTGHSDSVWADTISATEELCLTSEQFLFEVESMLNSSVLLNSEISKLINSSLEDATAPLSDLCFEMDQRTIENIFSQESLEKESTKRISDSPTYIDKLSKVAVKSLIDEIRGGSVLSKLIGLKIIDTAYDFGNYFAQAYMKPAIQVSDAFSKDFMLTPNKNMAVHTDILKKDMAVTRLDGFSVSDTFTRLVSYNRSFQEYVNSSDDFYGISNVDDDQYAVFIKTLVETLNTPNLIIFNMFKRLNDTPFALETFAIEVFSPKEDYAYIHYTDPEKLFTKVCEESVVLSHEFFVDFGLNPTEAISTPNLYVFDMLKPIEIQALNSDALSNILETPRVSEVSLTSKAVSNMELTKPDVVFLSESRWANLSNYMLTPYVEANYFGTNYIL